MISLFFIIPSILWISKTPLAEIDPQQITEQLTNLTVVIRQLFLYFRRLFFYLSPLMSSKYFHFGLIGKQNFTPLFVGPT